MEYSLLILGALVGLATLACAGWPLRRLAAQGVVRPGTWRDLLYFAGAGLGYMAVEMAFLQRIGLLLGHPNHALSLVLASLLLFTGLGSLATPFVAGRVRLVAYLVVGLLLFEHAVAFPALPLAAGWSFAARAALAVALIAPVGACLGVFLPTGIEALKRESAAHVPWAWGVNGIASVLAPVACVAVAESWGIGVVLLAGATIYAGVGALAHRASS